MLHLLVLGCATPEERDTDSAPPALVLVSFEPHAPSEACGECHGPAYVAWERSAHHRSHSNILYLREWRSAAEPEWCTSCHAPIDGDVDEGVGCASCHLRDGAVLNPTVSGRAPHRSEVGPIDETEACASCHQFHFSPGSRGAIDSELWLQDTVGEHERSEFRSRTCTDCHMPSRLASGEPTDPHALPGHEDAALLARALRVEASATQRRGRVELILRLRAGVVGHAVPTGDLYRELSIRAWPVDVPLRAQTQVLGRALHPPSTGEVLRAIPDTRVPPTGERVVRFEFRGSPERLAWEVELGALPLGHERARGLPRDALRFPLSAGELAVAR